MLISDKVAIVTGGASGIGAGIAHRFAQEGAAAVVIADVDLEGARQVAAHIGERALAVQCDVSREGDIEQLVEVVRERLGRVDIYFSNAGIPPRRGGVDLDDSAWQRMWQIHVMAHVWGARAVLPEMLERGDGYLVITASAAGLLNIVESAPYAATKHAAVGLAEWLRIAYGRKGVRVSCLCPQAVQSGMTRHGAGSAGDDEMLTPEHVAGIVVQTMREERFLILSHPQTLKYAQGKIQDYDRWLGGMQKLHAKHAGD